MAVPDEVILAVKKERVRYAVQVEMAHEGLDLVVVIGCDVKFACLRIAVNKLADIRYGLSTDRHDMHVRVLLSEPY